MNDRDVIIRPLVTERGTHLANVKRAYSFQVHTDANKTQIRGAIERIYKVKVRKVNTANRQGKVRRKGRVSGRRARWKKAVVYLEPEFHIDLF